MIVFFNDESVSIKVIYFYYKFANCLDSTAREIFQQGVPK